MFGVSKGADALNFFKWRWGNQSSLGTGLLDNIHHEIELSDYQRAPSTCSESPSGFLNGESFKIDPIADLDLFFERLYSYYCEKGLCCIIVKWVVELLSLAFTICFSGFFLLYVDWNGLRNAKCGMDAVESGIKPCDLAKEALHKHPLTPFTLSKSIIVGHLAIFSVYWIFCFVRFFAQLKDTLDVRRFYHDSLHMTDNEIQTIPWSTILDKVVELQSSQQLCVVKHLSAHDVVMRLMRKENYMIGMLNKGVIAFPISQWVPGVGPQVKFGPDGMCYRLILTKTLEWTLNWCILQSMFDRNFHVRRDFVSSPKTLKTTLMIVGFVMLLLSPFLVIFMLVYFFLRHAEQFYNHPSSASSRRWSNLSKWLFREYNEVDHLFKHRINSSVIEASDYLKQFPSPIITIIAKFISFVSGGFAATLIIIAFLEESLLEGHIYGRNLFWYGVIFGAITALSRAAVMDDLLVLDPVRAMPLVVQHTHYMPKRWRGKEHTETVRMEFGTLFQYTGVMLLEEMASIFLTPYLLIFVVPKRVDDILQFISDFTVDVEGVGHVCSFSVFDFQNHGNSNYGSPYNSPKIQRSSQGKMEKSFLSFHTSYPVWEPNLDGKQFLSNIQRFHDQQGYNFRPTHSSFTMHQFNPLRTDLQNCPYILDSYYKSQSHPGLSRNAPPEPPGDISRTSSMEFHMELHGPRYEENWDPDSEDRSQSHLKASVSAPLFGNSVLQHHDVANMGRGPSTSHWWARNDTHKRDHPQASFLVPPGINTNLLDNFDKNDSPRRGPQVSFLEPPSFNPNPPDHFDKLDSHRRGPQASFLEPSSFDSNLLYNFDEKVSHSRSPQASFLEPPSLDPNLLNNFGENDSLRRGPQASFLEPSSFKPNLLDNFDKYDTHRRGIQASFLEPPSFNPNSPDNFDQNDSYRRGPQASFLEPRGFGQNSLDTFDEYLSDQSLEEEETCGQTYLVNDLENEEFDLPFGDLC